MLINRSSNSLQSLITVSGLVAITNTGISHRLVLAITKNLLINRSIVSLIEPPLNIFFRLFCLQAEDLYNDGAIGGDGSVC